MSRNSKLFYGFLAGAAIGLLAATFISKEDREKMAAKLKEKASRTRDKLAQELEQLKTALNQDKNS